MFSLKICNNKREIENFNGMEWCDKINKVQKRGSNIFVFGKQLNKSEARIYCKTTFDTFFEKFPRINIKHHHYYEQIIRGSPIRLSLDIEADKKDNDFGSDDEFLGGMVMNFAKQILLMFECALDHNSLFYTLGMDDVYILNSCGSSKYSAHLIFEPIFGHDDEQPKYFLEKLKDRLDHFKINYMKKVGERSMPLFEIKRFSALRIYKSTKGSEPKRPLVYYGKKKLSDIEILKNTLLTYIPSKPILIFKFENLILSNTSINLQSENLSHDNSSNHNFGENKLELKVISVDHEVRNHILEIINGIYKSNGISFTGKLYTISADEIKKIICVNFHYAECITKIKSTGKNHEKNAGVFFLFDFKKRKIYPRCKGDTCKGTKIWSSFQFEDMEYLLNKIRFF